jgi:CubicO group peptidase (beta-lactamase class C family)
MRIFVALTAIAAIACSNMAPQTGPREPDVWPTETWNHTSAEAQGLDSARLASLVEHVASNGGHLHSLLIVRHGAVVLEASFFPYDGAGLHDIASCTKSLTSTGLGVAIQRRSIRGVDDTLLAFFSDRTVANDGEEKRAITLEQLLTMTSGLDCVAEPAETTLFAMERSADWTGFVLDLPIAHAPGTAWSYCSPGSHLISAVVSRASGATLDALLTEHVLAPIGVKAHAWPIDPQGLTRGWGDARFLPEDLARVGLLFLHRGSWHGNQLLDAAWIDRATVNRVGALGPPEGYGYQWWSASGGAYYASGRGGQQLYVAPALDLIVVTTGSASPDELEGYGELLNSELLPAVQSADAIPVNAEGAARLAAAIDRAGRGRDPVAPAPAPAMAATIGGRTFSVDENLLGWRTFAFSFGEAGATLELGAQHFAIGLDGVPRVTRGAEFAADERYRGSNVALAGRWTDPSTFELEYDTIELIDAGTLTFRFSQDAADIDLYERTLPLSNVSFRARAD